MKGRGWVWRGVLGGVLGWVCLVAEAQVAGFEANVTSTTFMEDNSLLSVTIRQPPRQPGSQPEDELFYFRVKNITSTDSDYDYASHSDPGLPNPREFRLRFGATRTLGAIFIRSDNLSENNETFQIEMVRVGTDTAVVATTPVLTILSNAGTQGSRASIGAISEFERTAREGDMINVPIVIDGQPRTTASTVRFRIGGTSSSADYQVMTDTGTTDNRITFNPGNRTGLIELFAGQNSRNIPIRIIGDGDDDNETLIVTLTNHTGGSVPAIWNNTPATYTLREAEPGLTVTMPRIRLNENQSGMYTVRLNAYPYGELVTVTPVFNRRFARAMNLRVGGADPTVSGIVFSQTNWNRAVTVTVNALDDLGASNDFFTFDHVITGGGNYAGLDPEGQVQVQLIDDDEITVVISFGRDVRDIEVPPIAITEGASQLVCARVVQPAAGEPFPSTVQTAFVRVQTTSRQSEDGGAVADDYRALDRVLTFTADSRIACFDIATNEDEVYEDTESFSLLLSPGPGNPPPLQVQGEVVQVGVERAEVQIEDNDVVTVRWDATAIDVEEGDGEVTLTASLVIGEGESITRANGFNMLAFTYPGGSAVGGEDFTALSGGGSDLGMFNAGNITRTISIPLTDDTVSEDAERFRVYLEFPDVTPLNTRRGASIATVTIAASDQPGVVVRPQALSIDEGGGGAYTVALRGDPGDATVVVTASIDDGSDAHGVTVSPSALTFTPDDWQTARTVSVFAAEDDTEYADEFATISHRVAGGGAYLGILTAPAVVVRVAENDTDPSDRAPALGASPGNQYYALGAPVSLTLPIATAGNGDITYTLAPLPAGLSYDADTRVLSGAPSAVTADADALSLTYTAADSDTVTGAADEDSLTFGVTVRRLAIGLERASYTVREDEGMSQVCVVVTYPPSRAPLPAGTIAATLSAVVGNTDSADSNDFAALNAAVALSPASRRECVPVRVVDDSAFEDSEIFSLVLTPDAPTSDAGIEVLADAARGVVPVTIDDNDPLTVGWSATAYDADEEDGGVTLTVALDVDADTRIDRADFNLSVNTLAPPAGPQSATESVDYTRLQNVTLGPFGNGNRRQTVVVPLVNDTDVEDDEPFRVRLSSVPGAAAPPNVVISPATALVTIAASDHERIVLSPRALTLNEGRTANYTVALSHAPGAGASVTVTPATTATNLTLGGALIFTAANWNTAQAIAVSAATDTDTQDNAAVITHTVTGGAARAQDLPVVISEPPSPAVCGRTAAVRAAILSQLSGVSDCADVSPAHLRAITELTLTDSATTALQSGDFAGLSALTGLRMTFSRAFTTVPRDAFAGLGALEVLELSSGSLGASLPSGLFRGLGALRELRLSNNLITALPPGFFDGLRGSLRALDLSSNTAGGLFTFRVGIERQANGRARAHLPQAAPRDLSVVWRRRGDSRDSGGTVVIPAGERASLEFGAGVGAEADSLALVSAEFAGGGNEFTSDLSGAHRGYEVTVDTAAAPLAAMVFAPRVLSMEEGGTRAYRVWLNAPPGIDVTATPRVLPPGALRLSATTTLTFTPLNWSRAQTVSVTAAVDTDRADDRATIRYALSGYAGVARADYAVRVADTAADAGADLHRGRGGQHAIRHGERGRPAAVLRARSARVDSRRAEL